MLNRIKELITNPEFLIVLMIVVLIALSGLTIQQTTINITSPDPQKVEILAIEPLDPARPGE